MPEKRGISLPYYEFNFGKLFDIKGNGLIAADIVHYRTGRLLMTSYMNEETFRLSHQLKEVVFWSRTRQELWHKGETSGNRLLIKRWLPGCELDSLEIFVSPLGPVCHRGTMSCFDQIEDSSLQESL